MNKSADKKMLSEDEHHFWLTALVACAKFGEAAVAESDRSHRANGAGLVQKEDAAKKRPRRSLIQDDPFDERGVEMTERSAAQQSEASGNLVCDRCGKTFEPGSSYLRLGACRIHSHCANDPARADRLSEARIAGVRANLEDVRGDAECFDALVAEVKRLRAVHEAVAIEWRDAESRLLGLEAAEAEIERLRAELARVAPLVHPDAPCPGCAGQYPLHYSECPKSAGAQEAHEPLPKPIGDCDMRVGPCSCGSWHSGSEAIGKGYPTIAMTPPCHKCGTITLTDGRCPNCGETTALAPKVYTRCPRGHGTMTDPCSLCAKLEPEYDPTQPAPWDLALEIGRSIPEEDLAKMPRDLSMRCGSAHRDVKPANLSELMRLMKLACVGQAHGGLTEEGTSIEVIWNNNGRHQLKIGVCAGGGWSWFYRDRETEQVTGEDFSGDAGRNTPKEETMTAKEDSR